MQARSNRSEFEKAYKPYDNSLSLKGVEFSSDAQMKELVSFIEEKQLTSLDFTFCRIKPICWSVLTAALKTNESLARIGFDFIDISEEDCTKLSIALQDNQYINSLLIKNSKFNVGILLRGLWSITHLNFSGSQNSLPLSLSRLLAPFLAKNMTLTSLNLSNCNLDYSDCAVLCDALKQNHTLAKLNISENKIGHRADTVLNVLYKMLEKNQSLIAIDMPKINYIKTPEAKELREKIESRLVENKNTSPRKRTVLKNTNQGPFRSSTFDPATGALRLDSTSFSAEKMSVLISFIRENKPASLFIFQAKMNLQVWQAFADELAVNKTIKALNITSTRMSPKVCFIFGKTLEANDTLVELKLNADQISPLACIELCAGLQKNKALTLLSLAQNDIGPQGFAALSNALKVNATLISLVLNSTKLISLENLQYLKSALETNRHLITLILPKVQADIGMPVMQDIETMLRRNRLLPDVHPAACAVRFLGRVVETKYSKVPNENIMGFFAVLPPELIEGIAILMIATALPELSTSERQNFFNRNFQPRILDAENENKKYICAELVKLSKATGSGLTLGSLTIFSFGPKDLVAAKIAKAASVLLSVVKRETKQTELAQYRDELAKEPLARIFNLCIGRGIVAPLKINNNHNALK